MKGFEYKMKHDLISLLQDHNYEENKLEGENIVDRHVEIIIIVCDFVPQIFFYYMLNN